MDDRNPQSIEDRKKMFKEEWEKDDEEMRQLRIKLADSMPKRCEMVIANNDYKIKY